MLVTSRALAPSGSHNTHVAVRCGTDELTYGALRDHASAIGDASRTWTVPGESDERYVALLGEWSPQWVATFLGLASAGWAVGVLDPQWSDDETRGALAQLNAAAVVLTSAHNMPPHLAGGKWASSVGGAVVLRDGNDAATDAPPPVTPDRPFYVGFTSGSAGTPKAFVRSHRSWWASFERFGDVCRVDPCGRVVIPGSLSSSHFLFGCLHGLHVGATVELGPVANAEGAAAAVYVVPTMLAASDGANTPGQDPGYIFCAGARLDTAVVAATRERFPASQLVEYYGASELSFVAIRRHGDASPPGSVGGAFPGVEIRILDENHQPVAQGETGEIVVRSDLVFSGYRGTPPIGAARSLAGGWWGVGDRGSLDGDGYLFIEGRGSNLIITGGVNVQPEEVEEVVATADGVAACVVLGLPDERWGEQVCAVLVPEPGAKLTRADIRRQVAAALSRPKRPRRYLLVDGPLPVGRSGKIDRDAVRRLIASAQELR